MLPESPAATRSSRDSDAPVGGQDDDFDTWRALQAVTQETRAALLADVVGHPAGAPSVEELDYTNPDVSRSTIDEHLGVLVEAGVVEKVRLPPGERSRDLPYTFYRITDAGRDLFDRNNLFDRAVWREQYERVEKPERILEAENAPRPQDDE